MANFLFCLRCKVMSNKCNRSKCKYKENNCIGLDILRKKLEKIELIYLLLLFVK